MEKMNLQLFAEDAPTQEPESIPEKPEAQETEPEKKYTDEDVDRIIERKFADWQKKQEKRASEAEKLGRMTAEEKSSQRLAELEERIQKYERDAARAEMTKQARAILQDEDIHVSDALLGRLVADDAESTQSAVKEFVSLFRAAVGKAVKDALKGDVPRSGGASTMTKEQILAVKNRTERQRLIRENMNLFK